MGGGGGGYEVGGRDKVGRGHEVGECDKYEGAL